MNEQLFLVTVFILTLTLSCTVDDNRIVVEQNSNSAFSGIELKGNINQDLVLKSSESYLITSGVRVKDGITLTIEPGTIIFAKANAEPTAVLIIEQGGKIIADGSAENPIVFTSSNRLNPATGDWGGIVIAGRAPINRGPTATAEVESLNYGGNNPEDNSGTLRYVRLEYTGAKINTDSEYNGFSFYGLGSGTTLEYLQAYRGNDDGFEWFGGTVNARYLVSTGSGDDSFDWTDGWVGNGQFWVAQQLSSEGDKGIEADNLSVTPDATPFSNPKLSNITLIGADDGDKENKGIEFRAGTKVNFRNSIVFGFPKGIEVDDDQTIRNANNGELIIKNNIISNTQSFDLDHNTDRKSENAPVILKEHNYADFNSHQNYTQDGTGKPFNSNGNMISSKPYISISGYVSEWIGGEGIIHNIIDPKVELGIWFESVDYIGAVNKGNDWTSGWTRK